ncbi:hypothetical protein PGIGA_G00212910 [Pangasianodon gigas]|uniref:Uncharacterized protein n=1 Tax=Pangasianodon gigas TaxID=30993 RepID=A0ACC5WGD9_PANGG|nr:hypothetical protein [Pangasianodon gigas]
MRRYLDPTEVAQAVQLLQDGTSIRAIARRARRPLVGPVLTARHRGARLAFAIEHQNWQVRHWRPVLFTDESRFTLSTCDRRERVWRSRGERYAACNIVQHDRFGGGSVMFWGGISMEGRTDLYRLDNGTLTAIRYRDEILGPIVRPYAGAVGPGFLLVHDYARPHVARVCRQFLEDEGIDTIEWPPRSPDLNPIEHLWDIMFRIGFTEPFGLLTNLPKYFRKGRISLTLNSGLLLLDEKVHSCLTLGILSFLLPATQMTRIFIYGTLKKGQPNHYRMLDTTKGNVKFLGRARTVDKYPLVIAGKYNIPFLLNMPGEGQRVQGEIYSVDDPMLKFLDWFESCPKMYQRTQVLLEIEEWVGEGEGTPKVGSTTEAFVYTTTTYEPEWLQYPTFDSYDAYGDHGLQFMTREARDSDNVIS